MGVGLGVPGSKKSIYKHTHTHTHIFRGAQRFCTGECVAGEQLVLAKVQPGVLGSL
jgi:hypothetical protein